MNELMKKFYTVLLSALFVVSATAGEKSLPTTFKQDMQTSMKKAVAIKQASAMKKVAPLTSSVVTEAPEGEHTLLVRDTKFATYMDYFGDLSAQADYGLAVDRVDGTDGKVWFSNPSCTQTYDSYYYGTKNDDGSITIPGGQCIVSEFDFSTFDFVNYYLVKLTYNDSTMTISDDIDYKLNSVDGKLVSANPKEVLAVCMIQNDKWAWTGYADGDLCYYSLPVEPTVAPEAKSEKFVFYKKDDYGNETGSFVNTIVTDKEIYIQGILEGADSWVKMTLEGDSAVMMSNQYLGIDDDSHHFVFAAGTVGTPYQDAFTGQTFYEWEFAPSMKFHWDAAKKELVSANALLLNAAIDLTYYVDLIENPRFAAQNRKAGTRPMNPEGISYVSSAENGGMPAALTVTLPPFDVEGNMLDTSRLYFNVYFDDDVLFTFYKDEYQIEKDYTNVPWSYNNEMDLFGYGTLHGMFFYVENFERIGVQQLYEEEDGSFSRSYIVYNTGHVGVDGIESEQAGREEYFDLMGRRVAIPENGLFIKRTSFNDGTVKTVKVMK